MKFLLGGVPQHLIKRTTFIPEKYKKYVYPFTKAFITQAPGVTIISQELLVEGCNICHYVFITEKELLLHPHVDEPIATLHCMLQGTLDCTLKNFGPVRLYQGQFDLFHVPNMMHEARMRPGIYESFHIDLSKDILLRMAPHFESVRGMLVRAERGNPVLSHKPGILQVPLVQLIQEIRECTIAGALKDLRLYAKLTDLLVFVLEERQQSSTMAFERDQQLFEAIRSFIITNLDKQLSIPSLASSYHISPSKLKYDFKTYFNAPIWMYIIRQRMEKARKLLHETNMSIGEVALAVGYQEASSFTRSFRKYYGHPPRREKKLAPAG
ncbi:AraC family transcriptional regulator [Chitinophaga pendula]|uniref:helix-turn-helix domain-containing protein n=1 Tax=Chitinophaga TaxID=79328 RepID=UPI000BAFD2D2|nr:MULTISPECIES: AraC family transcriptional regulator [Chitinophaga]ASZ12000.1 hypothetical protein CK934_14045 [Chitinophaga sp. MD30]UCJ04971.1 AraC family transcriptional regulator [Chitinophaga pendula]